MATYYGGSGINWRQYLQAQSFVNDITGGIHKTGKSIGGYIDNQTRSIITSNETINQNLTQLGNTMQTGFERMKYGLNEVVQGIENLNSDFNWAMGQLIDRVETQIMLQERTNNILIGILSEVSKYDDEKKIRGYIEQGLKNYAAGEEFMEDALIYFHKAEKLIPANDMPFLLYKLGQIYLYTKVNLEKSEYYFDSAGKYYRRDQNNNEAAKSYFNAGISAYLQKKDNSKAAQYAKNAIDLNPKFLEAYYNHAKFIASQNAPSGLSSLEFAIKSDRNYALKATEDGDFANIQNDLQKLMDKLREEEKAVAKKKIKEFEDELEKYVFLDKKSEENIKNSLNKAKTLFDKNTYFDYLDVYPQMQICRNKLDSYLKKIIYKKHTKLKVSSVNSISFSPDGRFLASGTGLSCCETIHDETITIKIWDTHKWKELTSFKGHSDSINSISFSPGGRFLASGSNDKIIKIWDTENWKELASLEGHSGSINSISFSPDGRFLASGVGVYYDRTIKIWDTHNWKELASLEGHSGSINSISFSPDGRFLASVAGVYNDRTIKIWDTDNWKELASLEGHSDSINSISFSPGGRFLASGSNDKIIKIWDTENWKELASLKEHFSRIKSISFSPDGRFLASGSDNKSIMIWDTENWKELASLVGYSSYCISFSPDGRYLASGGYEINIWTRILINKADIEKISMKEVKACRVKEEEEERRLRWRQSGRCELCGKKLSFWDKLTKKLQCKACRQL